ncbi:MAG: L,D-transpeptidase family protein [Bacteroidales bacterium]
MLVLSFPACFCQQKESKDSVLIEKFYAISHQKPYWFDKNEMKADEWLAMMESSENLGITPDKVLIDELRAVLKDKSEISNAVKEKTDQQITLLVLNFIKTLQQGNINFAYDEISNPNDSVSAILLLNSTQKSIAKVVSQLDCKDTEYLILEQFLHDSIAKLSSEKLKYIALAMNYRRFIAATKPSEYIVVNIPEAEARYYRADKLQLKMRTVVGKKSKPTPTIASYITSIVTFPYWNVPYLIGVKEILPKVQKDDNYLEQNNFEVVDAKGNVIDDSDLNWGKYDEKSFPYFFRQSTGAKNSLGVLKFNLQNPFSIFLHSTSWQGVFAKENRFLSHGCIRLEKPFDLANALLRGKLDVKKLKLGKENTEPKTIKLASKVPVYIIYNPVVVVGRKVTFLPDVYELIK